MVKFNAEDGHWVTIGGRRIFIQEGQSLPDAMKKSGKFKLTKEQKKAGVEVKESDFDKDFKDMNEDELKEHLNKLESGMDDFDEDEPQYKELQKEYNEVKKQLNSRSEENKILKSATAEEKENYYKNKAEIEKRDKMGQTEYLMEKQRERGNFKDKKSNELQRKADEVVEGMAKNKSYTQKDLDNAKAKMLEMEGTLDDAESDPSIKRSAAYKDIKKEYNDAKAEYDKISESLRNTSSNKAAKNQTVADRIMGNKRVVEDVKTGTKYTEIGNGQWRSEKGGDYDLDFNSSNKDNPQYRDVKTGKIMNDNSGSNNDLDQARDFIKNNKSIQDAESQYKWGERAIREYNNASKAEKKNIINYANESIGGRNKAYEKAFEEYKKQHPNTKLTLKQFMNFSEGK